MKRLDIFLLVATCVFAGLAQALPQEQRGDEGQVPPVEDKAAAEGTCPQTPEAAMVREIVAVFGNASETDAGAIASSLQPGQAAELREFYCDGSMGFPAAKAALSGEQPRGGRGGIASFLTRPILGGGFGAGNPTRPKLPSNEVELIKGYAEIARLSYCGPSGAELKEMRCERCQNSKDNLQVIDVIEKGNSRALLVTRASKAGSGKTEVIVAFRGTQTPSDIQRDMELVAKQVSIKDAFGKDIARARVHSGFAEIYDSYHADLVRKLQPAVRGGGAAALVLTGHSMGGALATIAAVRLPRALGVPAENVVLASYASPRVGNAGLAVAVQTGVARHFRVLEGHDMVPHVPWKITGYKHAPGGVYVYKGTAYKCQDTVEKEDPQCSYGGRGIVLWADDHGKFFSEDFFGSGSC